MPIRGDFLTRTAEDRPHLSVNLDEGIEAGLRDGGCIFKANRPNTLEEEEEEGEKMETEEEKGRQMGMAQAQGLGTAEQLPTGRSRSLDSRVYRIVPLVLRRSLSELAIQRQPPLPAPMSLAQDWMVISFGVSDVQPRVVSERPGLAFSRGRLARWRFSGLSASSALRGGARSLELGDDSVGLGCR